MSYMHPSDWTSPHPQKSKHMTQSPNDASGGSAGRASGEASGKNVGLHQPSNDREIADKLTNVDLDSRGAAVHDHLRDKRGNGVAGYDDSIKHDADTHYAQTAGVKTPGE
jgi:hypothetical protein